MHRRYPLAPLAKLRKHVVDAVTEHLATRSRDRARAEQTARAHQRARDAEESSLRTMLNDERRRLGNGQVRPADLEQAERYAEVAAERVERLRQAEAEAEGRAIEARDSENEARRSLREAMGRAAVVERHREDWAREQRRDAERREDEAVEDLGSWRGRR